MCGGGFAKGEKRAREREREGCVEDVRIGRGGEAKSIPTGLKKERDRCKFGAHFFWLKWS